MGGCRCYFRQCHVSNAKFPQMHFFRFPLKEPDRYKKWREYSKMEHMLQFSEVRRKNTSICARHFRIECFMNYKMGRLTPNAVPTIMLLSDGYALDFEKDIENGELVRLEKTTFKHLIPPDDFQCPLSLTNDKILLEKLNELQSQQCCANKGLSPDVEYVDTGKSVEYEEVVMEKSEKDLVNCVEILEVTTHNIKRSKELNQEERPGTSANDNKRCRILNTSIVLASRSNQLENYDVHSDEIDFVETEDTHELMNSEQQLFLSRDVFIQDDDSEEAEDIELIEIHKDENALHYELPSNDSEATIVQLKSNEQVDYAVTEAMNKELLKLQNQLLEYRQKCQDFDILQVRCSILESENNELKKICKENEHKSKQLLSLQMENNYIKKTLKDYEILKDKLHKCSEQNKKLKEDTASNEILRAEILSRKQESNELKKILETLKSFQSKEQDLKEELNLEIENERCKYLTQKNKLNEELHVLKRKKEIIQQQLKDTESELNEMKKKFNDKKYENDRLKQHQKELEQSRNNIQSHFDTKQQDYNTLKSDYDDLQQKHYVLEQKYWKLQALQNQESTVSTSLENITSKANTAAPVISFTKAQLFNGIKRYLSASMVSLLRMEMFGSSEREWKSDERLVAVDILRLGEMVYKYFTDEWRFRLPALRDVRVWLNQSQQINDDEDF